MDNTVAATGTVGALIRPLAATEYVTSQTYGALLSNTVLSSAGTLQSTYTDNSLTLNSGGGLTINPMQQLVLGNTTGATGASGGLLAQVGNAGISGGFINVNGLALYAYTPSNTSTDTTTISSQILGTAGINKAGGATLSLTSTQPFTGTATVNQGTLKLNAGTNTIAVGVGATGNPLIVNSGGTVDLNGNVQIVSTLSSSGAAINGGQLGGIITSATGGTLVANSGAATFAGSIQGAGVNFMRSGAATIFTIVTPQTYTGTTVINGGGLTAQTTGSSSTLNGLTLTDNGSLASSTIILNYASLNLNNTNATLADSSSRLSSSAALTLNGGNLNYFGRPNALSTQTVGAVVLGQGASVISASNGASASVSAESATLTLGSLSRTAGSGATVQFAQNFQNTSAGALGQIGDASGRSENILITANPTLTSNIIGGWATVVGGYFNTSSVEFASYNATYGVGALNLAGYAGYDGTALVASQPGQNIRLNGTALAVTAGGSAVNSLNVANSTTTAVNLTFTNPTDVLNLTSGGLIVQNVIASAAATTIGAAGSGIITAGGPTPSGPQDLYFYYQANGAVVLTVNSKIADNGASPVRLVASGGNFGASNITLQGTNTYTGGTVINGETLTVGATGTLPAPTSGTGIIINGGTLAQTVGGIIAAQSVVMNGGSTLTLAGSNTLSTLAFNNNGGAAPNISTAGTLLTLTGDITANSMNVVGPSVITAGNIEIGAGVRTITTNPVTFDGTAGGTVISPYTDTLRITAVLQSAATTGSLAKAGTGILELNGASTFAGGVDLQAGGLYLTLPSVGTPVTSGPLGIGNLTISGNNTTISGSAVTVANNIIWGGSATSVTIGQYGGAALVLSGSEVWGSGIARTLISNSVAGATISTQTLSGTIFGSGSIVKQGPAVLAFTGSNVGSFDLTAAQAVKISNGTVSINSDSALGFVPAAPVTNNIVIDGGVFNESVASITLNPNRGITLGGTATMGVIDVTASTFTIPGVITSTTAGLVKTGAGILQLTGGNTYTGQTIIGGTAGLTAGNSMALGTTTAGTIVLTGSALNLDNTTPGGGIIIGAETLNLNGTGVASAGALQNVAGPNVYGGNITLDSAASIVSTAGVLTLAGTISSSNPASASLSALTLAGAQHLQLNGVIGSSISTLTRSGAGTAFLNAPNTYTGLTTISAGAFVPRTTPPSAAPLPARWLARRVPLWNSMASPTVR